MIPSQPLSIAELTRRSMAELRAADDSLEVEPHEALTGARVDAQAAWLDAQLPLSLLGAAVDAGSAPAEWSSFVHSNSGRLGIPMAAGYFPQALRDVAGLFAADLVEAPVAKTSGFASRALGGEAELNQRAANLWNAGQREAARAVWESMTTSVVQSFNLGMAALMLGHTQSAQVQLSEAIASLPESSGWSQLASLYLPGAKIRD